MAFEKVKADTININFAQSAWEILWFPFLSDFLKLFREVCCLLSSQGFIQAILMSVRRHNKLNLLSEISNSILYNFILKYIKSGWCRICIKNKLACQVFCILSYLFALQNFQSLYPLNPLQGSTKQTLELRAPLDLHLHFTIIL